MVKNVRMRLLLVMQVLTEQTDEKHGLTMKEILEWITEKGIPESVRVSMRIFMLCRNLDYRSCIARRIRHTDFSNKSDAVRSE